MTHVLNESLNDANTGQRKKNKESNLCLAKLDRDIKKIMKDEVLAIFRYVDDYLVFHRMNDNEGEARIAEEMISLTKELAGD